jgi:hypothetical protein
MPYKIVIEAATIIMLYTRGDEDKESFNIYQ